MNSRARILIALAALTACLSAGSPVNNFCLVIKNRGETGASVSLDGKLMTGKDGLRLGRLPTLTGTDLVVWIESKSAQPLRIVLAPAGT